MYKMPPSGAGRAGCAPEYIIIMYIGYIGYVYYIILCIYVYW